MDATKAEVQLDDISWHVSGSEGRNNSANHFPVDSFQDILILVRGSGRSFNTFSYNAFGNHLLILKGSLRWIFTSFST